MQENKYINSLDAREVDINAYSIYRIRTLSIRVYILFSTLFTPFRVVNIIIPILS